MNYKKLGNTDLEVSTICLGTMTWGEQNTQEEGFEQMDYALDQGVNFWDTAEIYSVPPKQETFGDTEVIIGNWFEKTKKREKIILASKVCGPMREYVRGGGNQFGEKNITAALEGSLRRLKTDYIDLYQLHWPERKTNFFGKLGYVHDDSNEWTRFEDILGNLQKFISQGKVKHIGVSNETPWGLSKYLELSKERNLPRILSAQNPYNLLNRTYEVGLAEISVREQVGLLAYSPLACGYLSGKYRNKQLPKDSRMERDGNFWTRYAKPNTEKAVEAYYEIAKKHNLDLTQMSLKFLEIQPFVTSVIIGATTMEQLKTNIESVNIKLTEEIINDINEVQAIYPNPCP
ncbi:aldo/keto reductase [Candidatus Pelagibacter sp.]|nr:aldo/keto reductase [Candidatus Pelagibacter sp.]